MKTYKTMIATTVIAGLLLSAFPLLPGHAPAHAASQAEIEKELEQMTERFKQAFEKLDSKIIEKATQALQKFDPGQEVKLVSITGESGVGTDKGEWTLTSGHGHHVNVDKQTGEIKGMSANRTYKLEELDKALQADIQEKWGLLELKGEFTPPNFSSYSKDDRGLETFSFSGGETEDDDYYGNIDPKTRKVSSMGKLTTSDQVDQKIVKAAEEAMKKLPGASKLRKQVHVSLYDFNHFNKTIDFQDQAGSRVGIDSSSGKPSSVTYDKLLNKFYAPKDIQKAFAKPYYTKEKAISAAKPMAKKHFDLDLTGYEVKVKHWEYTFTKKGQPTVTAFINEKGQFWEMRVMQ
ncbi:hypothetical protein [Paenibacillus apiarius]|uniref:hypothetical protein n=1 Tax=Paenibacillus apiarius TaxID=46240 RepID=UPI003B3B36EA